MRKKIFSKFRISASIAGSVSFGLLGLTGCTGNEFTIDLTPIQNGNVPSIHSAIQFDTWTAVATGIDIQQKLVEVANGTDSTSELLTIIRFDPSATPLRVAVDIQDPKTISEWQETLNATVVMNGSYFDESHQLTTQVVTDGETYGNRLTGKTAFLETTTGQDWNIVPAQQAADLPLTSVQSYPLLLHNGEPQVTESSEDRSPRTMVAQDKARNMYFVIAEYGLLTLQELDDVLVSELNNGLNLELTTALNLDGGTSTGLVVAGDEEYLNESIIVPVVLYIE